MADTLDTPTNPTLPATAEVAARVARQYLAVWNEADAKRRRALITEVFTPDARYVDPMASSAGHDGIDAMIAAVQQQFSGLRFTVHGAQDGHNQFARFSWALGLEGAAPVAYGTDVVTLAEDGRISSVTGFLDAAATVG